MVVGAVRPGRRRRPRHHLVLRAQGRFQGASQGLFTVKPSCNVILVCACVGLPVCLMYLVVKKD